VLFVGLHGTFLGSLFGHESCISLLINEHDSLVSIHHSLFSTHMRLVSLSQFLQQFFALKSVSKLNFLDRGFVGFLDLE